MPSVRVSSHLPTYTFSPICMGRSNIARPTGLLLARVLPIPQQSPRATQPKVMELIWRGQIRDLFHRCVPPDCGTPPYRGTAPYRSTGALLRRGTPTLTAVRASYYDAVRQPYRDAVRQLYRDAARHVATNTKNAENSCYSCRTWAVPTQYHRPTRAASSSDFVLKSEQSVAMVGRWYGAGGEKSAP